MFMEYYFSKWILTSQGRIHFSSCKGSDQMNQYPSWRLWEGDEMWLHALVLAFLHRLISLCFTDLFGLYAV